MALDDRQVAVNADGLLLILVKEVIDFIALLAIDSADIAQHSLDERVMLVDLSHDQRHDLRAFVHVLLDLLVNIFIEFKPDVDLGLLLLSELCLVLPNGSGQTALLLGLGRDLVLESSLHLGLDARSARIDWLLFHIRT